jgi:hypothetical protein
MVKAGTRFVTRAKRPSKPLAQDRTGREHGEAAAHALIGREPVAKH